MDTDKSWEPCRFESAPAEVKDRAVPGHWEGDLLCGGRKSHIATLVERHSRFTMLVKVTNKDTETVVEAITKQMNKLPIEPAPVPHLGQRHRNGATSSVQRRHRRQSLLLRSSESLAARTQTKTPTGCCANTFAKAPTSPLVPGCLPGQGCPRTKHCVRGRLRDSSRPADRLQPALH